MPGRRANRGSARLLSGAFLLLVAMLAPGLAHAWACVTVTQGPEVTGCAPTLGEAVDRACAQHDGTVFSYNGKTWTKEYEHNYGHALGNCRHVAIADTGGSILATATNEQTSATCPDGSQRDNHGQCVEEEECPGGGQPDASGYCYGVCTAYEEGDQRELGFEGYDDGNRCVSNCEFERRFLMFFKNRTQGMYAATGNGCGMNYPLPDGSCAYGCDTPLSNVPPPEPGEPTEICEGETCIEIDDDGNTDGPGESPGDGPDHPTPPGCNVRADGTIVCNSGGSPDGPRATDSDGPDITVDTNGDGTPDITIDTPDDGKGRLPEGTPFDLDGDGNMDGVVGSDGLVYPDADNDGLPDAGSSPALDATNTGSPTDPTCKDDPRTTKNECGDYSPYGECVENPHTWERECLDSGAPCFDDPKTPKNECGGDPEDCEDDPNTMEDECAGIDRDGDGDGDGDDEECVDDPTTQADECGGLGSGGCEDDPQTPENECDIGDQEVGLSGCESPPVCSGSVMDCAVIQLQWESSCSYHVSDTHQGDPRGLKENREEDSGDFLWKDITELEGFSNYGIDFSLPSGGTCPAPYDLTIMGQSISVPWDVLCTLLEYAGILVFIGASILSIRIAVGA